MQEWTHYCAAELSRSLGRPVGVSFKGGVTFVTGTPLVGDLRWHAIDIGDSRLLDL